MRLPSVIAIYALFWAMSFFLVLPFRLQRRGRAEERPVPGEADSGFGHFSFARTCGWTTIVSALIFGMFFLNYRYGWVPIDRFDFVPDSLIEGR